MNLNHVTANYKLLNDRIAHWRSILNEKIDANTKDNSSDVSPMFLRTFVSIFSSINDCVFYYKILRKIRVTSAGM